MVATQSEECVEGQSFLEGIRSIIGMDPNVPREEVQTKPFTGSFSIIKNENDPALATTKYCLTDNACGHWEAYSKDDVPLTDLSCNSFCYISKSSGKYLLSKDYTTDNPPNSYFSCGWETCG
jgi:hypothetical protein